LSGESAVRGVDVGEPRSWASSPIVNLIVEAGDLATAHCATPDIKVLLLPDGIPLDERKGPSAHFLHIYVLGDTNINFKIRRVFLDLDSVHSVVENSDVMIALDDNLFGVDSVIL